MQRCGRIATWYNNWPDDDFLAMCWTAAGQGLQTQLQQSRLELRLVIDHLVVQVW